MGQNECLKVLEKSKDWLTAKQIAEKLGQSPGLVNRSLKRLYDTGCAKRRNVTKCNISTKYEWRLDG